MMKYACLGIEFNVERVVLHIYVVCASVDMYVCKYMHESYRLECRSNV